MNKLKKSILNMEYKNESSQNNINRGKPIYFKNILHYISYEFDDNILISLNKDLSKIFCVKKTKTSIKPVKK